MKESVIVGYAGLAVMGATAALAAALLTWEPSVPTPVAPAGFPDPAIAEPAAISSNVAPPELPCELIGLDIAGADVPAPVPASPIFAAPAEPAGVSSGFRIVSPDPGFGAFSELPRPTPADAVRDIVRREVGARDSTLTHRSILPPPRPAFVEVPTASASLTEVQPVPPSAWSEPLATTPLWSGVFASFGEPDLRSSRPERTLQSGMASWYGPGFHGRRTASGEVFNQNALTAAHRHLPFGTKVRVVDQTSGRSIVVRINDRGPFSHGRVIDLSKASAQALGMSGTARVKIVSAE